MNLPDNFDPLSLDNQLCFALYVCSKEIIRRYKPLLDPLNLTYTEYITLMSLWEKDDVTVKELGQRLFLDSGTLTPLLKKMEKQNLLTRRRSTEDERTVYIKLTSEGKAMHNKCKDIPAKMSCCGFIDMKKAPDLMETLHQIMNTISVQQFFTFYEKVFCKIAEDFFFISSGFKIYISV